MVDVTTHRASIVSRYLLDTIGNVGSSFGIKIVYYGDQTIIKESPAVCVVPTTSVRSWQGTSFNTDNDFETSILIYGSGLRQDSGDVQLFVDELTEDLADYLTVLAMPDQNLTEPFAVIRGVEVSGNRFGGLVTAGLATRTEYAYKVMGDELTRMNRIIFTNTSRTQIVGNNG